MKKQIYLVFEKHNKLLTAFLIVRSAPFAHQTINVLWQWHSASRKNIPSGISLAQSVSLRIHAWIMNHLSKLKKRTWESQNSRTKEKLESGLPPANSILCASLAIHSASVTNYFTSSTICEDLKYQRVTGGLCELSLFLFSFTHTLLWWPQSKCLQERSYVLYWQCQPRRE